MPIDSDYAHRVIAAYAASPARMGAFPLPDLDTVYAAETLKDHLVGSPYSHAVEVARINNGIRDLYVFANSGAPGVLNVDVEGATSQLRRVLGPLASFAQIRRDYSFYEPQHRDVAALLGTVRAGFNTQVHPALLVRLADVQGAIANFTTLVNELGHGPAALPPRPDPTAPGLNPRAQASIQASQDRIVNRGQASTGNNGDIQRAQFLDHAQIASLAARAATARSSGQATGAQKDCLKVMLAAALALRLRLIEPGDVAAVSQAFDNFIPTLRRLPMYPFLGRIADLVAALIVPATPLPAAALDHAAFQATAAEVLRVAGQSRFCAEPRVFSAVGSQAEFNGSLVSQICFWYGGAGNVANPVEYQVIGPQATPANAAASGSYMWACSSCCNRSAQMVGPLQRLAMPRRAREV
ncbi:hypothetical protein [Pseudomonas sp. NyZ201]|uniref:hypothetical protein n=1 Tax=Pseudomonas sp. NyZ201 TaxID=3409857 RepID=UPI003CE6FF87